MYTHALFVHIGKGGDRARGREARQIERERDRTAACTYGGQTLGLRNMVVGSRAAYDSGLFVIHHVLSAVRCARVAWAKIEVEPQGGTKTILFPYQKA